MYSCCTCSGYSRFPLNILNLKEQRARSQKTDNYTCHNFIGLINVQAYTNIDQRKRVRKKSKGQKIVPFRSAFSRDVAEHMYEKPINIF